MITAIILAVAFVLLIDNIQQRDLRHAVNAKLANQKREYNLVLDQLTSLKAEVKERGLLHAPVRIEVVVGNAKFQKGHIFNSTRECLRALGRDSDGKLPKPNDRGTIQVGDLVVRKI